MRRIFNLHIVYIVLCLGLLGCYNPKDGVNNAQTRSELGRIADRAISIEKKYLLLTQTYVKLLDEAAAKRTDEAAMDHLRRFYETNAPALTQIGQDFDGWQRMADQESQSTFSYTLYQEPSTARLATLTSQFRKRISYKKEFLTEFDKLMSYLEIKK